MADGFDNLLFWDAFPHESDEEHAHDRDHKMIIFSGDMEVTVGYETVHLGAHDYFEIPRGTVHLVRVGPDGCRYLLAERL